MKPIIKNIVIRFTAIFMISIISLLIVNNILFIHTHKFNNGSIIIHSHPYNKTDDPEPVKSHHHSKAELLFLESLAVYFFPVLFFLVSYNLAQKVKCIIFRKNIYTQSYIILHKGRAPPVLQYPFSLFH